MPENLETLRKQRNMKAGQLAAKIGDDETAVCSLSSATPLWNGQPRSGRQGAVPSQSNKTVLPLTWHCWLRGGYHSGEGSI